jgi:hypothetical protein
MEFDFSNVRPSFTDIRFQGQYVLTCIKYRLQRKVPKISLLASSCLFVRPFSSRNNSSVAKRLFTELDIGVLLKLVEKL